MDTREVVLLATLAVAMFNVGVSWLTQVLVYPVWALPMNSQLGPIGSDAARAQGPHGTGSQGQATP